MKMRFRYSIPIIVAFFTLNFPLLYFLFYVGLGTTLIEDFILKEELSLLSGVFLLILISFLVELRKIMTILYFIMIFNFLISATLFRIKKTAEKRKNAKEYCRRKNRIRKNAEEKTEVKERR